MENVVVGVSAGSEQGAVEWVARRSREREMHVLLVRAFDMLVADPNEAEKLLDRARATIASRSPGTEVRTSLVMRSIADALVGAGEGADLLVLGSHHRRPLASVLSGAIPLRVAARSRCATVIVPDDWTPARRRTIVVGIADDDTSDRAMLFAAREAQQSGAELEAVHAWSVRVPTLVRPDRVEDEADQRAGHRRTLSAALERIRAAYPRVQLRGVLEQRDSEIALAERAAHGQLLVIGSHRRGPVTGLVLGSSARAALRVTTAPLCIVPPTVQAPADEAPAAASASRP